MLACCGRGVYNATMIRQAFLLIALVSGLVPVSVSAPVSAVKSQKSGEQAFRAELQRMVKSGSEDFCKAAQVVLTTTGSEQLFWDWMNKSAAAGNAAAQTWLAMNKLLYVQSGTPEYADTVKLLESAASKQYAPALIVAAALNAQTDEKKSQNQLMEACKLGSSKGRALYLMKTGRLAAGNLTLPEVASELRKENYHLEEMMASLQTVEAKAAEWLLKAEKHGSATAPFMLSQVVIKGETEHDRLAHMKLAAERGNLTAMHYYGSLLCSADVHPVCIQLGIKKDWDLGMRYVKLAAVLGMPDASADLALRYAQGQLGEVPAAHVYRLFEHAYKCGVAEGFAGVGYCKVLGVGCAQDATAGLALMLEARDKGALWVNHALASVYFNGTGGIEPDLRKAVDFLAEDAAAGSASAYAVMAAISALGNKSAKADPRTAEYYLDLARRSSPSEEKAQQIYDAIILTKDWVALPDLVNARLK